MKFQPLSLRTEPVRILVVDDHPNTAATLARALAQLGPGVQVISATNGPEALEKVKGSAVDILITDMIMPDMTGLELIEKLQNHPGGKPSYTYLVTAYDVPGLKVTAQRLKVNEVIVKPVRPERICQIATKAMEEMNHAAMPQAKKNIVEKKRNKILIVDDKQDNVTLLARYLDYEGYENLTAMDGEEALEKVRNDLPDLVLLDVNMPKKDGFTVLGEIRSDPAVKHIPVIILTAARLDPMDVQSGLNLGADDYVTKPFDRHELMARIRTKLRVKESDDIVRRRNRELGLLPEIGKELSARPDLRDLANVLLKRTVETLGAYEGHVVLVNPEDGSFQSGYHFSPTVANTITPLTENPYTSFLYKSIKDSRQGVLIENSQNDPRWISKPHDPVHSAIAVPLYGRRELLGLITLTHELEKYFTIDHLLLLQAIASQASIAVENSRLYAEMAREQKWLNAILKNADDIILLFDDQGRLNMMNPAGEKLFANSKNSLHQPLPINSEYESLNKLLSESRTSKSQVSGDVALFDQHHYMARIAPMEDGGQVAFLHDLSRVS